jgi:hypothetical protein
MPGPGDVSDDTLRHMTSDALRLYQGFEEIFPEHIIEAVMRNLSPEFDRERVQQIVAEFVH